MLNNIQMRVVQTAPNGVVNEQTIFHFTQKGRKVSARYSGGYIEKGFLVGILEESILRFSYCQLRSNGLMDHGESECLLYEENGKVALREQFEMQSAGTLEKGTNIFKQI